ncbi:MAG: argininosuccinate lyase [Planctomycetes bacterium]|nr:argininosuccinate lyase [Planctomycetota bacterium]
MSRLWDKGKDLDQLILAFTVGRDAELDQRLVAYDLRASLAHATMLQECGHLRPDELEALRAALAEIGTEHAAGAWAIDLAEEDCHTAIENRLIERLGSLGGKIHLGRSRNDQVLAALRLYLKDAVAELQEGGRALARALDGVAERAGHLALPGYTHMQRAMPSSVALWAGGWRATIEDDVEGLGGALRRIDRNPLGSAAGYGTPGLELDRERSRELCGFASTEEPVTAVQLARGKAEAQLLFEVTLLMQDIGRLAAELCLWNASEFGFVRLPEAMTTGSSIMPQKRNPDLFELLRGQAALARGRMDAVLDLGAKLPSGYHRDLQLIKAPLFDGLDAANLAIAVMERALGGLAFVPERLAAAMSPELHAAERAFALVTREGLSFREAYRRVAAELEEERG